MGLFNFIFGKNNPQVSEYLEKDAVIVDVRSQKEFDNGHIQDAVLIPLPDLDAHIDEIKGWNKPIITCCASGIRSQSAAGKLRSAGIDTINGGGWSRLQSQMEK